MQPELGRGETLDRQASGERGGAHDVARRHGDGGGGGAAREGAHDAVGARLAGHEAAVGPDPGGAGAHHPLGQDLGHRRAGAIPRVEGEVDHVAGARRGRGGHHLHRGHRIGQHRDLQGGARLPGARRDRGAPGAHRREQPIARRPDDARLVGAPGHGIVAEIAGGGGHDGRDGHRLPGVQPAGRGGERHVGRRSRHDGDDREGGLGLPAAPGGRQRGDLQRADGAGGGEPGGVHRPLEVAPRLEPPDAHVGQFVSGGVEGLRGEPDGVADGDRRFRGAHRHRGDRHRGRRLLHEEGKGEQHEGLRLGWSLKIHGDRAASTAAAWPTDGGAGRLGVGESRCASNGHPTSRRSAC